MPKITFEGFGSALDGVYVREEAPEVEPPAKPEFMGFGKDTKGGEGGGIIWVTNLNDSGQGSLRAALEWSAPRIVRFDVTGTIDLESEIQVGPNVTIEGDTAPGILTVRGARLQIVGSEVIMRGMRLRPGDGDGQPKDNRDCISIGSEGVNIIENIVIDGNSFTWSTDELLTVWRRARNISITNNIIAEALRNAGHSKGNHSMGILIGGTKDNSEIERVTFARNLCASAEFRMPRVKADAKQIEIVNNLFYNYGSNAFDNGNGTETIHLIGNHFEAGPNSGGTPPIRPGAIRNIFMLDNIGETNGVEGEPTPVFQSSGIPVMPSADVRGHVVLNAGPRERDNIDLRIDGLDTRWIDSPSEVGGYL